MSRCPGKGAHNFWTGDGVHPLLGKGMNILNNEHIALLPKKVTIPIWDKYVQMENICWYNQMLSENGKQEIQIPPEKKSKYPKVVGSLSAEVLFHSTLVPEQGMRPFPRFHDSTQAATARIFESAEQIQRQVKVQIQVQIQTKSKFASL